LVINSLFVIQYFADRDIFCAGRVSEEDLHELQLQLVELYRHLSTMLSMREVSTHQTLCHLNHSTSVQ
ncbi:hypothetical protein, partial [Klebsiella pneumoniae]|uniref:hypothetical protein n=1 Tax=Klebsiella pneumoniae TaxID=573 RepID=UPI003013E3B4